MRYNALKSCAALLCRACEDFPVCVAEHYLTLRTGCERYGRKKLCRTPVSERSHVGNLRQIRKQGKGRSSKRKENRRLSFLFAPAAGVATFPPSADGESPAEVQRKTPRPERANPLAQFVCPAQPVQRKEPPRQGEPADAVRAPRLSGAEKEPPVRANTLTQFVCPAGSVQKTSLVFKLNCFSDNATAKRHTQVETA